jgi:Peptidase family M28
VSRRILAGRVAITTMLKVLLLVSALTLGALLASCGASKDEEPGNTPNATTQPSEEASGKEPPSNVAQAAAASIDEPSIRENLSHLTGASPAPLASGPTTIAERGSEDGRRAAAQYMKESFEEAGVPARILEFTYGSRRGFNVEGTLEGTEGEKHLWITAHLDSFYNAGANDDASGLVSILSSAKALKRLNPKHTIHLVAYDLEEVGLVGSTLYVGSTVSDIREEQGDRAIIGNIHSDMVGYDEGGEFEAVMGTCGQAGSIDEALLRALETIGSPIKIPLSGECPRHSDHKRFWDADLPAVLMIDATEDDYYPWYHRLGYTLDKVNIPYLRSTIQLSAAAAALLAAPESGS